MKISVLTLFPEYFDALISTSIISRARAKDLFSFETVNFRDFTKSKQKQVDDTPYGGGAGMVLTCQPIADALKSIRTPHSHVVLLSPQGKPFNQEKARVLAGKEHLIMICGHYEGFDERIRNMVDEQISLGDFVLTGGEPAAAAICDAVLRLQPGVIKADSSADDSFSQQLLEYPQYTKPYDFEGMTVPDVLLSGHHANIARWRHEQSLLNTAKHRIDLLDKADLDEKDLLFLKEQGYEKTESGWSSPACEEVLPAGQKELAADENPESLTAFEAQDRMDCKEEPSSVLTAGLMRDDAKDSAKDPAEDRAGKSETA